jgi:hypothetical protein
VYGSETSYATLLRNLLGALPRVRFRPLLGGPGWGRRNLSRNLPPEPPGSPPAGTVSTTPAGPGWGRRNLSRNLPPEPSPEALPRVRVRPPRAGVAESGRGCHAGCFVMDPKSELTQVMQSVTTCGGRSGPVAQPPPEPSPEALPRVRFRPPWAGLVGGGETCRGTPSGTLPGSPPAGTVSTTLGGPGWGRRNLSRKCLTLPPAPASSYAHLVRRGSQAPVPGLIHIPRRCQDPCEWTPGLGSAKPIACDARRAT